MDKTINRKQYDTEMNVFDGILDALHKQLIDKPDGLYTMPAIIVRIEQRKRQYKQDYEDQFD